MRHAPFWLLFGLLTACTSDTLDEEPRCSDTCIAANDGDCDDDGEGSITGICDYGTDCGDCGIRIGPCVPHCGDAVCGSDGCGGDCGTCTTGQTCVDGRCDMCHAAGEACFGSIECCSLFCLNDVCQ